MSIENSTPAPPPPPGPTPPGGPATPAPTATPTAPPPGGAAMPPPFGGAPAVPFAGGAVPAPAVPTGEKSFLTTWLLSLLVGIIGVDRFYLGKIGTGILKLVTIGGFGIWYLIDLIMVLTGATRDRSGHTLAGYQEHKKIAWIVTGAVILLGIILNIVSPKPELPAPAAERPALTAPVEKSEDKAEEPAMAIVPEMVGTPIGISRPIAESYGLIFTAPADATDDSIIASQSIEAGEEVEEGTEVVVTVEPPKPTVPVEYTSALNKAQTYSDLMHMSKAGLYDQLTSEYGEQFTPEAAQYAVDNVDADWNANALAKAKDYQETMSMSPAAIHDQLTSQYGEQFTAAEADYAIAHLND